MKFLKKSHDGGRGSGVTGYWLIEWKWLFSIVLLRFSPQRGDDDRKHSHAFNALTWWIKGEVEEIDHLDSSKNKTWRPSFIPKYTPRTKFHRIEVKKTSWAISFRGPWKKTWQEHKNGETYQLSNGRVRI